MTTFFSVASSIFICSYSSSLLFIQSSVVVLYPLRLLVPSLLPPKFVVKTESPLSSCPSNCSVCAEYYSSNLCFHPPYPKLLDWIGDPSSWFSFTRLHIHISNASSRCISFLNDHVALLQHTTSYSIWRSLLSSSLTPTSSSPKLPNCTAATLSSECSTNIHIDFDILILILTIVIFTIFIVQVAYWQLDIKRRRWWWWLLLL